ncbi:MAG: T9SS type A sorting domain-containing protein, partial [Bacteroidales bacterium]|nr:T9SS type A sorting domain-containing protein [Bacteroidales bacterium]
NAQGQTVFSSTFNQHAIVDVSAFQTGIYIIKFHSKEGKQHSLRFLKI